MALIDPLPKSVISLHNLDHTVTIKISFVQARLTCKPFECLPVTFKAKNVHAIRGWWSVAGKGSLSVWAGDATGYVLHLDMPQGPVTKSQ